MAGGIVGGLIGGKPSKSSQKGQSGTDIGKGLAQTDQFINSFGAPPSLFNLAPGGGIPQPQLPYVTPGNAPAYGTTTNQTALPHQARNRVAFAPPLGAPAPQAPSAPREMRGRVAFAPQGATSTSTPAPAPAAPPTATSGQVAFAPGAQAQRQQTQLPGPASQGDIERTVMDALGIKANDAKRLLGFLTPEQIQALVQQQTTGALSDAEVPTAQRTRDYGDSFRLPSPQATFGGGEMNAAQSLGYGFTPDAIQGPGAIGTERVAGAAANAAQIGTGQQEFEDQARRLYESQFAPQQQELLRQQTQAERGLKSQLANAGLATSGTGIAQEMDLTRDFNQRLSDTSRQAATQASAQAFGMQQEQRLQNAAQQQQANLANAGFTQQAQVANASNILAGNMESAKNYLATLGLDLQQAQQYRDFFLQVQGLRAADLERMDAGARQNIEMALNTWLQELTAVANIGRYSEGTAGAIGPSPIITV